MNIPVPKPTCSALNAINAARLLGGRKRNVSKLDTSQELLDKFIKSGCTVNRKGAVGRRLAPN